MPTWSLSSNSKALTPKAKTRLVRTPAVRRESTRRDSTTKKEWRARSRTTSSRISFRPRTSSGMAGFRCTRPRIQTASTETNTCRRNYGRFRRASCSRRATSGIHAKSLTWSSSISSSSRTGQARWSRAGASRIDEKASLACRIRSQLFQKTNSIRK